jgi:large subunit ribosomal protein L15
MPLQRRLPKIGFASKQSKYAAELRLNELAKLDAEMIDLRALKEANLVPIHAKRVKVIASGKLGKVVNLQGISVTKGARAAIEALGGTIN